METLSVVLGFLSGLGGGFCVLFVAPFAILTGFRKAGVGYLVLGLTLFGIAYGLGMTEVFLLTVLAVALAALVVFYLLTIPIIRSLPKEGSATVDGVTTVEDAVEACRRSELQGWNLVAYAQKLTAQKFNYSRRNSWDSPSKAFERGLGYCQQQALALNEIYQRLGFDSKPVYCNRCRFPPPEDPSDSLALVLGNRWLSAWFKGRENVFGHSWVRVRIGEEELDVCPGNPDNRPGVVDFEPLLEVKGLNLFLQPLAHLGSALGNLMLEREARRAGLGEAQGV